MDNYAGKINGASLSGIVSQECLLIGEISNDNILTGTISNDEVLEGIVRGGFTDYEPYEESYFVESLPFQEQVLNTKNKKMIEDVVIKKIPYSETSNTFGITVSISS